MKTKLNRSILLWKTEYLDGCSTAIKYVVRKVAVVEGGLVSLEVTSLQGCSFQTSGLVYDNYI